MCKCELTKEQESKKEVLYNNFKKNKNIKNEISNRNKIIEELSLKIKQLQDEIESTKFELNVLEEIKDSQKIFIEIDCKIDSYLKKLKANDNLNTWKSNFTKETESVATHVYSIKNATYTATIIVNESKKRKFYRVDFEFAVSTLLLSFAKEYKLKFQSTNDIVIKKEGKILYNEQDKNEYIESLKDKYKDFFQKEKAALIKEFKDVNNKKYCATDFIKYDDMIIDEYSIVENVLNYETEEIPF